MGTYTRFLYEFLAQFFAGLITIVSGIGKGIGQLFNIPGYAKIIEHYKNDFSIAEWLLVVLAVLAVILVVGMGFALIFLLIKKYIKFRAKVVKQEELLDEVTNLNKKVVNLMKEKDEILAMKVSQLGLKPTESNVHYQKAEENQQKKILLMTELDLQNLMRLMNNLQIIKLRIMEIHLHYQNSAKHSGILLHQD